MTRLPRPARFAAAAAAAVALTAWAGCGPARNADRIVVSAAISLSDVLRQIAGDYERSTGRQVALNLGGSDTLAAQLVAGAPVDLFFSADQAQMDRVAARGRILPETRVDLVANQLALVVSAAPGGAVSAVDDLRSAALRRLAIGDPAAVPAGVYARAYLDSVGLWEHVAGKVVPTRDVKAVAAAVAAGHADAGFVYRTDLASAAGLRLAAVVPLETGPAIRYPAAVVAGTARAAAARRLLEYLQSAAARRRFERAGFIPLRAGREPA